MISNFEDLCLWIYVIIDDEWKHIQEYFRRPGPVPSSCSDSELLTMALVGEMMGWDRETQMLYYWQQHRDLFPRLPSQSRFNRRRRWLSDAFGLIRQRILARLHWAYETLCIVDSMPIEVVAFQHAPRAASEWQIHEASFGRVSFSQRAFFGYKLHLLVTYGGVIVDWELASAHLHDLPCGLELLEQHQDLWVLADKAYIQATAAAQLLTEHNIRLLTLPRTDQRLQLPEVFHKPFQDARRRIETVNSQLSQQFHIQVNHAHSFFGLCARLATKITAHTLSLFLNWLLGKAEPLPIKALAFPL
jgi:hypothetical protein